MIDWQRIWNDDDAVRRISPTRAVLSLFSLLYGLIVFVRNRLYDKAILRSVKLSCPVISVGNITVGGTGKTPCVIHLAKMLQRRGFRPAVISRGYGGKSQQPVNIVADGKSVLLDATTAGDEPLLIARSLKSIPVITGPKRELTGRAAIERFGANILICDDAFQHRRLHRDIDIVLLDGRRPLGNGHLLPRGELREKPAGLARASCFLLTRMDPARSPDERIAGIARQSGIPVYTSVHRFADWIDPDGLLRQPHDLKDKKVGAFCGIAKPDSFRKLLVDAGAAVVSFNPFPDHYAFSDADAKALCGQFRNSRADYLITTEKDAMRLAGYPDFLKILSVARVEMDITPSQSFENLMVEWAEALSSREDS